MDDIITILQDPTWKPVIGIIAVLFIILCIFILNSYRKGNIDQILGIKINNNRNLKREKNMEKEDRLIINAKNVNTGTNYGSIGDIYTGIPQRIFNDDDKRNILSQINQFKSDYSDKIVSTHITIGFPGDKESESFAKQIAEFLSTKGYGNIRPMILQTYGIHGKRFGVSNAPDNSIMIEVYPADNV